MSLFPFLAVRVAKSSDSPRDSPNGEITLLSPVVDIEKAGSDAAMAGEGRNLVNIQSARARSVRQR